jgi:hypothetical protein
MIGAFATVLTALFQLITAFRSASSSKSAAKAGGMRSFMWTLAMVFAAAVGGFAYAEFRSQESRDDTRSMRTELQAQMQALQASTARLEQMRYASTDAPAAGNAGAGIGQTAGLTSAAMVTLPACKGAQVGFATERPACTEQESMQVGVCAHVPAAAQIAGVELFSRSDDAQTPWLEARAVAGQSIDSGRFAETHVERADAEQGKLVCQTFWYWGGKARTVRMVVRYSVGVRTPG